ncbi:hypothetical protein U746_1251 [Mycolicibacterium mucogenicum 261Sha1.1M5]|nr:hypothetical protein U746_1251 [Mycolicibacterium mucogenicum 261Sha1.1M5]
MRKTFAGTIALAAAGLMVSGGLVAASPAPAHADHPNTVCSFWGGEADSFHVRVDWLAGRSFRVAITDFTLVSQASPTGDAFVPLPLDPSLRVGANTVEVGEGLTVSDVTISQAVALEHAGATPTDPIANYLRIGAAPWESVEVSGQAISWVQDIDARSDERGVQLTPSAGGPPAELRAASAGVLDFTLTLPDTASGEVTLLSGLTSTHTDATFDDEAGTWAPNAPHTLTVPGCSVTVEAVDPDATTREAPEPPAEAPPAKRENGERDRAEAGAAEAPARSKSAAADPEADQDRATPTPTTTPPAQRSDSEREQDARIAEAGSPSGLLMILIAGGAAILGMTLLAGSRQRL